MESYPIISLPRGYDEILHCYPPLPNPPSEPAKPEKPIEPTKSTDAGCLPVGPTILFLGLMVFGFFFSINEEESAGLFFVSLISIIVTTAILIANLSLHNESRKKYPERLQQYYKDLDKYNVSLKNYEAERKIYLQKLDIYNQNVEELMSSENIRNHRLTLLKDFYQNITKPIEADTLVNKGASEEFFFSYLRTYFDRIYQNRVLKYDYIKLYPDFTFLNQEKNLCIDIEIDEPYVGSNGDPIHYSGSYDNWRNNIFNYQGWVVIRFTEEQIIKQPLKCCELIKRLSKKFLNLQEIDKEKLVKEINLESFPTWTKDEAHRMAYRRYRSSYLPTSLQSKIKDENFDFTTQVEDKVIENWRKKNDFDEEDLPF